MTSNDYGVRVYSLYGGDEVKVYCEDCADLRDEDDELNPLELDDEEMELIDLYACEECGRDQYEKE